MTGSQRDTNPAERGIDDRLVEGRRRVRADHADTGSVPAPQAGPRAGAAGLAALQRSAGNAAVSALLAGRWRSGGGEAVAKIDAALTEIRRDEPDVTKVEPGLRAAKAAGVPVDLDGYAQKPPASALNVVKTGFGPGAVPAKKPVPPAKPTAPKSPLARASAPARKPRGGAGAARRAAAAGPASTSAAAGPTKSVADPLAAPVPPTTVHPRGDPGFVRVTGAVKAYAKGRKAHPPAAAKAKQAQDAALAPSGDLDGQAKAAKVDTMDAQPAGGFDKKAFIAAVKSAIEAKSPKNLKEAADYKESGKAGEVKGEVKGLVSGGKQSSAEHVETATAAPPDQSKAVPKAVNEMPPEQPGQEQKIPAAVAAPKAAPAEQTNLQAGKHEADQTMTDAEVTEPQLAESGEPAFEGAVAAKQEAAQHADTAPAAFREEEKATLGQARADADAQTATTTAGMHGSKLAALAKVVAGKTKAKSKDETRRAEVTTKVQSIFAAAETDVKKILAGIDPKVDKEFEAGEKGARAAFEQYVAAKMAAYKKDRYGGWLGGLRWAKDKLFGMPAKVNEFFDAGRELYLKEMDKVISRVADVVATDLTAAKTRIAKGRAEIATYVQSLPKDLKKVGAEATKEIGDQFGQLESDVNSKQDALVDSLASKYVTARKGLDERIEALQAENKGLVDKAIGAIKAVINTIRELAAMLRDVFAKAAAVVGQIIKAPSKFLDNLIAGVKGGILKFKDNILTHLKKGLMGWLLGSLAEGGIELPDSFDLKGIVKLVTSIFGLTWANIRSRLVKAVGEPVVGVIEKSVDVFTKLATEGPAGIWHLIVEKVGDIKDMIIEKAKDFVIEKIITAGITWLIGLLNPAAAFIKACKLIYDVVMFFIENGSRIMKFVNTVIDSVSDIARGAIGGVVDKIESVLGQMVPILIGFLASLLGVGGIGKKIKEIVQSLQKPVNKAIDSVIGVGLKLAGPLIKGIKGISKKVKAKVAAGKAYVKGKVEAGKKWAKAKVYGGDDSRAGKQRRLDKGMAAAHAAVRRFSGRAIGERVLRPVLGAVRVRYGLTSLTPEKSGDVWAIHGVVNPTRHDNSDVRVADIDDKTLRKSIELMRKRVGGDLDKAKKRARLVLIGSKSREQTVSEAKLQADLTSIEARYAASELRARALTNKTPRADLVEIRDLYTAMDTDVDSLTDRVDNAGDHLIKLRSARDSVRRARKVIDDEAKKGVTAAALVRAENKIIADELTKLRTDVDGAETGFTALDLSKADEIEKLRRTYETLQATGNRLLDTVKGLRDPAALETERARQRKAAEDSLMQAGGAQKLLRPGTPESDALVAALETQAGHVRAQLPALSTMQLGNLRDWKSPRRIWLPPPRERETSPRATMAGSMPSSVGSTTRSATRQSSGALTRSSARARTAGRPRP